MSVLSADEIELQQAVDAAMKGPRPVPQGSGRDLVTMATDALLFLGRKCHRNFIPMTRPMVYDAVPDTVLYLGRRKSQYGEVATSTGLTITVSGSPLTLNTHYKLLPNDFDTAYDRIKRYSSGLPVRWDAGVTDTTQVVTVTGSHGWTELPGEVRRAAFAVTMRLQTDQSIFYQSSSQVNLDYDSIDGSLLWDGLVEQLMRPFVRRVPHQQGV